MCVKLRGKSLEWADPNLFLCGWKLKGESLSWADPNSWTYGWYLGGGKNTKHRLIPMLRVVSQGWKESLAWVDPNYYIYHWSTSHLYHMDYKYFELKKRWVKWIKICYAYDSISVSKGVLHPYMYVFILLPNFTKPLFFINLFYALHI